jgi:hypothetical protein
LTATSYGRTGVVASDAADRTALFGKKNGAKRAPRSATEPDPVGQFVGLIGTPDTYTIVSNEPLQDPSLSFKATGIIAYLKSKPKGWVVRLGHLCRVKAEGRHAVRSGIQELIDKGYGTKRKVRNAKGQIVATHWIICETRGLFKKIEQLDLFPADPPNSENPISGNPKPGDPRPENRPLATTDGRHDRVNSLHTAAKEGLPQSENPKEATPNVAVGGEAGGSTVFVLIEEIAAAGVDRKACPDLAATKDLTVEAVRELKTRPAYQTARNPAGWLVDAIRKGWWRQQGTLRAAVTRPGEYGASQEGA